MLHASCRLCKSLIASLKGRGNSLPLGGSHRSFAKSNFSSTITFLYMLSHDFGYVLDGNLFFFALVFNSIIQHGQAKWTAGGNGLGTGGNSLIAALLIDALTQMLFHKHAPPASTAAKALALVHAHLFKRLTHHCF